MDIDTVSNAYRSGESAEKEGLGMSSCPYEPGSARAYNWKAGWNGVTDEDLRHDASYLVGVQRNIRARAGRTARAAKRIHDFRSTALVSIHQDVLDVATAGGVGADEPLRLMRRLCDEFEAILDAWEEA